MNKLELSFLPSKFKINLLFREDTEKEKVFIDGIHCGIAKDLGHADCAWKLR